MGKDTRELTKQCPSRHVLDLIYHWTSPDTVIRSLLLLWLEHSDGCLSFSHLLDEISNAIFVAGPPSACSVLSSFCCVHIQNFMLLTLSTAVFLAFITSILLEIMGIAVFRQTHVFSCIEKQLQWWHWEQAEDEDEIKHLFVHAFPLGSPRQCVGQNSTALCSSGVRISKSISRSAVQQIVSRPAWQITRNYHIYPAVV